MPGTLIPSPFAQQVGSLFRGDWAAGDLAYGIDFSGGVPEPPFDGDGNQQAMGTLGSSGTRPDFTDVMQITNSNHTYLHCNQIPNVAGKVVTQVSFWWSVENSWIDPNSEFVVNGVTKANPIPVTHEVQHGDWSEAVVTVSATDPEFRWNCLGQDSVNITGLQVFVAADPYMLGEFVLFKGKMWKSLVDNNSSQPNQSDSWEHVATNTNQTYATAARPSASSAGAGASIYDSDLELPLFSNGTAWTDATGAEV